MENLALIITILIPLGLTMLILGIMAEEVLPSSARLARLLDRVLRIKHDEGE